MYLLLFVVVVTGASVLLVRTYDARHPEFQGIGPILPSAVCERSDGFLLSVSGEGFSTSSVILWNGSPQPTKYIRPAELHARINGRDLTSAGSVKIQVADRGKLGRTSEPIVFHIVASCANAGPLHVSTVNPRYFTDARGKAVYLTGSHTWDNFKELTPARRPRATDFGNYLNVLQQQGHNFIRLWTWDLTVYNCGDGVMRAWPFPWLRTGPGKALDGGKQFDLWQLNQAYFDRLRARVMAAQARGMYVSVMLFEGYALEYCQASLGGLPFVSSNNVNGIDAPGTSSHTLADPAVLDVQEAYVRRVIDALNDMDNVLFEVSNESGPFSTAWQYHMIRYIKAYEATKPKQHPVGMTFQYPGGNDAALFSSPADWISPGGMEYKSDPPPATGAKVILADTDHLFGVGGDRAWVWKSFTRGLNPLFMDDMSPSKHEDARYAMGDAAAMARKIDLLHMVPHGELSSTTYCLAKPGEEYLVYSPIGGTFTVDLRGAEPSDVFKVEWLDPGEHMRNLSQFLAGSRGAPERVHGGGVRKLITPFSGDSLLLLERAQAVIR
jgi:Family of unknown function (DUF6298)/Protein of unknown function (DUF4038)